MTVTPGRVAALATLRAVRGGELADRALRRAAERLAKRERSWTRELVYGTLRLRGRLDHVLARAVHRPLSTLDGDVLDILRLGSYQLLEMRSVPAYAAVSQSVELAKRERRAAAGLVNGALQAVARQADAVAFPSFADDPLAYLTSWGSHPEWVVRRWVAAFGPEATQRLCEANNARPALHVRPVGLPVDLAVEMLTGAGIRATAVPGAPDAIRIGPGATPRAVLSVVNGIVQDPAAGLVARYVAPPPGSRIADLCAAPGGKAIALADMCAGGSVFAADISPGRIRRLRDNVRRIDPIAVVAIVADARCPPIREADVVLVDAPCTGTGTFARRPDARWRMHPDRLERLCRRQAELLDAAARIVRPGGVLVYATCSIEVEENDGQIEAFLGRHPGFQPAPPESPQLSGLDGDGRLRLRPHEHGFDGAFAARLRRN